MDINPEKLIKVLGAKSPREQKEAAINILASMPDEQSAEIKEIMADKDKIQSILSSPQAQQLLNKLKGKQ